MRILSTVIFGVLIAAAAFAAPCATAPYSTYATSGFSCTDGDATFSNFSGLTFTNSAGVPTLSEGQILVIPGISTLDPTLTFEYITAGTTTSAPVTVSTNGADFTMQLTYQLVFTGATLSTLQMDSTFANSSPGSVSATKNASAGGPTFTSSVSDGGVSNPLNPYLGPVQAVSGTGTWSVVDTTSLQAQTGGSATQASFENLFVATASTTTTPEPATMALIGSGLLGVGICSRRRRASNS